MCVPMICGRIYPKYVHIWSKTYKSCLNDLSRNWESVATAFHTQSANKIKIAYKIINDIL